MGNKEDSTTIVPGKTKTTTNNNHDIKCLGVWIMDI